MSTPILQITFGCRIRCRDRAIARLVEAKLVAQLSGLISDYARGGLAIKNDRAADKDGVLFILWASGDCGPDPQRRNHGDDLEMA